MPELPDVESIKVAIQEITNKKIVGVHAPNKGILKKSPRALGKLIKDKKIESIERVGKYLFLKFDKDKWLALHFGMTGDILLFDPNDKKPAYSQLIIEFRDNSLAIISRRQLGFIDVVASPEEFQKEKSLGPDALSCSWDTFKEIFEDKNIHLKNGLMDQKKISGIGNIYADEILFAAKLLPKVSFNELTSKQFRNLFNSMHRVLSTAISNKAAPQSMPKTYLINYRKEGADCPKCEGQISKTTINGRGTYYCESCQEEGHKKSKEEKKAA